MLRGSAAWSQATCATSVPDESPPPICLDVSDLWDSLQTKNYSFTGILRSDALTLENLRELTACRAQAYENSSVMTEERLSWQVAFLREQGRDCLYYVSFGTPAMPRGHCRMRSTKVQTWHCCIVWIQSQAALLLQDTTIFCSVDQLCWQGIEARTLMPVNSLFGEHKKTLCCVSGSRHRRKQ